MKLTKEARKISKELFRASFTDGRLNDARVRSLVGAVAAKKPRHYIDILKNYQRLIRLESEKHSALIESAVPLDPETRNKVTVDLKTGYGSDLAAEFKVNPELLGGLRIKIGSNVWDGSIQNRLNRLEEELTHA
jgi:F-type H+-transporting ATPase subunit delta